MASSTELEHVLKFWAELKEKAPIYQFLLSDVEIVTASRGLVTARLTLGKNHVNSRGTIHGAVSATLVDWSGGIAIATHGLEKTGASIDIHVTYIGTAHVGDLIEIEATANRVGRPNGCNCITYKIYTNKPELRIIDAGGLVLRPGLTYNMIWLKTAKKNQTT